MVVIAVLGNRGIPPRYGGFDSVAWNLAQFLPKYGVSLYMFSETSYKAHRPIGMGGVRIVYLPVINRFLIVSEVIYDVIGLFWASLRRDIDLIYLLGYSAAPFCIVPRLLGKKVAINVDGLEWKRRKFSPGIRFVLRQLERICHYTSSYLVFDSMAIRSFHVRAYGDHPSYYMPQCVLDYDVADVTGSYYLAVARIEPENNLDLLIQGFLKSGTARELWIVGSSASNRYIRTLKSLAVSPKIRFLGPIYGKTIQKIRKQCFAYLHGHEVGGTNPSLLEALSHGNAVLSIDVPFNREVAGNAALYFKDADSLCQSIKLLESSTELSAEMRKAALSSAERYDCSVLMPRFASDFRSMVAKVETTD